MIHIIIPMLPSPEFPGRALQLWPYTMNWLATELLYTGWMYSHHAAGGVHSMNVLVCGRHSEIPARLPADWTFVPTEARKWEDAAMEVDGNIGSAGDMFVVLRPETPLRERGLFEKVLDALLCTNRPVVTSGMQHRDNWRELDASGRYCNVPVNSDPRVVWDGQVVAWPKGMAAQAVDPSAEHIMVRTNHVWTSLDISIPPDMPPGLSGMASDMLLASIGSKPLPPLSGNKVLLIGSGRDLVGRNMGAGIDAGEYGLVVRCNKYYGSREDVGSRTDIAIIRWPGWEHAFFQSAPEYPRSWITINDGRGIPGEVIGEAIREVGHDNVSCGIIAAKWLAGCGADVSVIGIGRDSSGNKIDGDSKVYPDGVKDNNEHYDWTAEDAWWDSHADKIKLI